MRYPLLTADEAARLIRHGEVVGFSGFTNAGAPKVVPAALAAYAREEHEAGRPFRISLMVGASNNALVDGALAEAKALERIIPYQGCKETRRAVNTHETEYVEYHVSLVAQAMRYGHLPRVSTAVVEACEVTDDGELTLTTAQGNAPTYCLLADRIIVELNSYHDPAQLRCLHDIYVPQDPPHRISYPLNKLNDRIGTETLKVDPAKIVAVVRTCESDHIPAFRSTDEVTDRIGERMTAFLEKEYTEGRIPEGFLPLQSGVGNVANAVLAHVGRSSIIPPFSMYTEVLQDTVIDLMKEGHCSFASSACIHVSDEVLKEIYANFDFYRDKILLRPQEISNNPSFARRIGLISMNTALEADLFGNINSTHLFGNMVMNGVGGSGDFARSAAYTIFSCPSTAKNGTISAIVPMVSHTDHTEHDVDVLVTEQGVADLRGKSPRERAELIIEHCAHPDYRPLLRRYLELTPTGHTPASLRHAFAFHLAYQETGDMRHADLS